MGRVHSYRRPGTNRSMTNAAPAATSAPKTNRAGRALGVVLGSLIMKKVKSISEPLSNWWIGTLQGWPIQAARAKRMAA